MAVMVKNLYKIINSTSANTGKILVAQFVANQDQTVQLNIIVKQLATQYEQTAILIASITKPDPRL